MKLSDFRQSQLMIGDELVLAGDSRQSFTREMWEVCSLNTPLQETTLMGFKVLAVYRNGEKIWERTDES